MKTLLILCLVFTAVAAIAGPNPYDEKADAKLDIKQALAGADRARHHCLWGQLVP